MSRRHVPNVSASLIHEARMIIQQFFGARQENYYSMRIAEAQAKAAQPPVCKHQVLKCSFCSGAMALDARYVINGNSACQGHEAKARATVSPRFNG